jgi:hypothetical protein
MTLPSFQTLCNQAIETEFHGVLENQGVSLTSTPVDHQALDENHQLRSLRLTCPSQQISQG